MKSTLLVMATETGKTIEMAELSRRWPQSRGRIMLLAHREELIKQAAAKFKSHFGAEVGIEMADLWVNERVHADFKPRIVAASVQTLTGARLEKFDPFEFGLILTDEAHHAIANGYRSIYRHFAQNPNCVHVGVTATPDRADEVALGAVYDSVAYEYDLLTAINDGYLVPVQQEFVECDGIDLSSCKSDKNDLKDGQVAKVMEEDRNLYEVADATRRIADGRKTIIFAASVAHAHRLADILSGYEPGSAIAIDGKTDKDSRRHQLSRFSKGGFRYLCNCGIATEGYDEPSVEVVSVARPTKSRALYAQMIGRGTRVLKDVIEGDGWSLPTPTERKAAIETSAKPFVTVLDFVGNSGRHKLICTADLLGGDEPDEIVERAIRNAKGLGKPANMQEEIEAARHEIEAERERSSRRLTPEAKFRRQSVNPFDILHLTPKREPGWFKGKKPSEKMRSTLLKFGVNEKWVDGASFNEARVALDGIFGRIKENKSSIKQVSLLRRFGIDATDMSFQQASNEITRVKENGWRK